jgi:hypothetical protein
VDIKELESLPDTVVLADHWHVMSTLKTIGAYSLADNVFLSLVSGISSILQSRGDEHWPLDLRGTERPFATLTLMGKLLEAISFVWKVPLEDVWASNDLNREDDILIGSDGERELRMRATMISKPK